MNIYSRITLLVLCCLVVNSTYSQKKYQSLMWKISGNGLTKPSYIYGTMHVSGKMVFHLGDPFYNALQSVDIVALELEPEAWLEAIFEDKSSSWYARSESDWEYGEFYSHNASLPPLKGAFALQTDIQEKVVSGLMYDPSLLNYMLFRYSNYGKGADFEEDTWLDMYLYQAGKKLGKQTLGLETYSQSSYFLKKAREEERKSFKKKAYDSRDREDIEKLQSQMEPAYRRQDLDLIDSLNKKTTSEAFDKYILVERNKVFVHCMDSVMRSGKNMFSGMGCAHLPGKQGVIEMLRAMGYEVEPVNKGERNAKRREQLEKTVYKRAYKNFTTDDQQISFDAPTSVYPLFAETDRKSWISLDMPNGASFIIYRAKSFAGLRRLSNTEILNSLDSILYESVAGKIISQKRINIQGNPAIDIINKTRRGDYHRKLIVLLPEEVLVFKLTANGDKVKNGYGNEFFKSIKFNLPKSNENNSWTHVDGSLSLRMPGYASHYAPLKTDFETNDVLVTSHLADKDEYYIVQRHTVENPGFIDEDLYELNRLADAFQKDNYLTENWRSTGKHQNFEVVKTKVESRKKRTAYSMYLLQNLDYHVFTAVTNDSLQAEAFFASVKLAAPVFTEYYEHLDTLANFKVRLPYKPRKNNDNSDYFDWYAGAETEVPNPHEGSSATAYFRPPGSSQSIDVFFRRFNRYSDMEDSLQFVENKLGSITNQGDYRIDKKKVNWTPNGVTIEAELSDTLSTRKILHKSILHNKSIYDIETTFDSLLGPGQFVYTFFNSFEPTDTVFAFSHFKSMDLAYLNELMQADSAKREFAFDLLGDVDFDKVAAPKIREMLLSPPKSSDKKKNELLKKELTKALKEDTSDTNLKFLSEQFYKNSDSADYQQSILKVLMNMKTKESIITYKKLLLDDPPVSTKRNSNDIFAPLYDSLELAAMLMPELQQTVALNEYEFPTYQLMATLIDSNLIKKSAYEKQLDLILLEAKNELKRLNATDEDTYNFSTKALLNYCSLLHPYRNKQEVTALFDKIYRSKKINLLLEITNFNLQRKHTVPDSIITKIINTEDKLIPLCIVLEKHNRKDLLPKEYADRDVLVKQFIRSKFKNKYDTDQKVDSIAIFNKSERTIKGQKLDVYFCKYKMKKSEQWRGMILAFDATEKDKLWPRYLERSKTIVIDTHEDEVEELNLEYKMLEENNRRYFKWQNGGRINTSSYD